MIVSFISTNELYRPIDLGIRSLSAYLREKGCTTKLFFLPYHPAQVRDNYPKRIVGELKELLRDSNLIGISCNSLCALKAAKLTNDIRSLKIPIVWGGVHSTFLPEDCLEYADMVCVGEGEESLAMLISKMESGKNIYDTPGIWFRRNGKIISNGPGILLKELDQYPPYDYSMENHFILHRNKIVKLEEHHLKRVYTTMSSRGCIYKCSYCAMGRMSSLYRNQGGFFRRRSIPNLIDELIRAKKTFPTLKYIWFIDSIFLHRSKKEIEEFVSEYKKHIGIPFEISVTPTLTDPEVIRLLVDAGLAKICIGVQTGSDRLNSTLYERKFTRDNVLKTTHLLRKYANIIKIQYDFLSNEEHELDEDVLATINLVLNLPRASISVHFELINIPGTIFFDYEKTSRKNCDIFSYSFNYYGVKTSLIRRFKEFKRKRYLQFVLQLYFDLCWHRPTKKFAVPVITFLIDRKRVSFFNRYPFFVFFLCLGLYYFSSLVDLLYVLLHHIEKHYKAVREHLALLSRSLRKE